MTRKRPIIFLKYFTYVMLLVVLYVLQTTPRLFQVGDIKPNLLVPAAVCIALFEGELAGGIYGAVAGLLCDLASYTLFGFNSVLVLCLCVAVALLTMYLMQLKLTNALLLGIAVLFVRGSLEYFFYFQIWGYTDSARIFWMYTLPRVLFSTVAIVPLFYLVRRLKAIFDAELKI